MGEQKPLSVGWLFPVPPDAFWAVDRDERPVSRWPLLEKPMVLGRADDADIRIRDPGISRRHLTLTWERNRLMLTHLSRTNPTFVNGLDVSSETPTELQTTDMLELGSVRFQVLIWPADGDAETKPHPFPAHSEDRVRTHRLSKNALMRGFRVGSFHVDPRLRLIKGPDGTEQAQPKVIDVLLVLASRSGDLAERDEILDDVWGRYASEEVLTRCISELRRLLADDPRCPAYIQT
ncbi:MAG: FHA domain-containing protein, partial [Gammaproteobacteria bacterium]